MDRKRIQWNTRTKILVYMVLALIYLAGILVWGLLMDPEAYAVDYSVKFRARGIFLGLTLWGGICSCAV